MTSPEGVSQTAPNSAPVWNSANAVTMVRVALVPIFAILVMQDNTALRLSGVGVFLLAALTDKLDGYLARSRNLITSFGKIADPIADKALVLTALIVLTVLGIVPWWVPAIIIVRELGITVLRFAMLRRAVMAASAGGKLKTVLQITAITALLVPWQDITGEGWADAVVVVSWVVLIAAIVVTTVTGVDYVVRAWRLARSKEVA